MRRTILLLATMALALSLAAGVAVAETFTGTLKDDRIVGTGGDDTIRGLAGNDDLFGLRGNDSVRGGTGNDLVRGERGNDTLNGNLGRDNVFGGKGGDRIFGGDGDDELLGQGGNDRITAFNDNNVDSVDCGRGGDDTARVDLNDVVDGEVVESLLELAGNAVALTSCETIVVNVVGDTDLTVSTVTIEDGVLDQDEIDLLEDNGIITVS
jgi:Ca2+-binding RTX toxin-like protein